MRPSILSITSKLALLFLALWVGEANAQTTTIRGGSSANTAAVTNGGLHIICDSGCAGGGGTQYAEDTAHASGDSVTMAGVVQQSADAALSGDGDRSVLQVDANGYLKVNIKAGAGSGGTAMVDDAAFTPATTSGTPAFFLFDDVSPDSVNEGDGGIGRMSANRNQYVTLRDAAGNERGLNIDASGNLTANIVGSVTVTDGSGALNVICDSGCAGGTQYDEDAAETAGGKLTMAGSVRRDTAASSAGTTGDNATINTDSTGRLWTRPTGGVTPANSFAIPSDAITVWSINGCHNGTTIDFCAKATGGNGAVDSNTQRVTLANDSTGVLATVSNVGTIGTSVTPGNSAAHLGKAEDAAHSSGDTGVMLLGVRASSPTERSAGPTDGDYEPLGINAAGALWVTPTPTTTGGLSIFRSIDLDETEEDIKTSAGQLYGYYFANLSAGVRHLKFYNATAASVTVGTTTPILTFPVAAGSSGHVEYSHGIPFATALSAAVTTGVADSDTGAPGANDFVLNVFYK